MAKTLDLTDTAALTAWLASTRATLAELHRLAFDATEPKGHRKQSRAYLRDQFRKHHRALTVALSVVDPAPVEASP